MTWEPYVPGLPKPSRDRIAALQARIGIELPGDYIEDLLNHSGDTREHAEVPMGRGNTLFGPLLYVGAQAEDATYSYSVENGLDRIAEWYADAEAEDDDDDDDGDDGDDEDGDSELEWRTDFWPFGKNLSTGYFCFDNRPTPLAPIVFLNMEYDPDEEKGIMPLAQSYAEFLASLR